MSTRRLPASRRAGGTCYPSPTARSLWSLVAWWHRIDRHRANVIFNHACDFPCVPMLVLSGRVLVKCSCFRAERHREAARGARAFGQSRRRIPETRPANRLPIRGSPLMSANWKLELAAVRGMSRKRSYLTQHHVRQASSGLSCLKTLSRLDRAMIGIRHEF